MVVALFVVLVFALAAFGALHVLSRRPSGGAAASTTAATTNAAPPALRVGLVDCTFVDTSRPTYNYATDTTTPGRRLVTEVRYPTTNGSTKRENVGAHAAYRRGPFPLVVFAPGYDVDPGEYKALLDFWVKAGYVVAAPIFPDTNPSAVKAARLGSNPEDDDVSQPADVAFVTRRLEAAARGTSPNCAFAHGLVATGPVGLAGQSDGGNTVAALAYARPEAAYFAGLDVKAVAVLSGAAIPGISGYGHGPALLFTQSPHDACNLPTSAAALYNQIAQPNRWFLETTSRTHIGPYNGREPAEFALVARVTTAFWRTELRGGATTAALRQAVASTGKLGTLTVGGPAPAMSWIPFSRPACYVDV